MLQRLIILAALIGAVYWYWSGPYQEKTNPGYEAILKENKDNMAQCVRSAAYQLGATGTGTGAAVAEKQCADKYNLYQLKGNWHSYDAARRD
jgi:hypothetical protein